MKLRGTTVFHQSGVASLRVLFAAGDQMRKRVRVINEDLARFERRIRRVALDLLDRRKQPGKEQQ